MSEVKQSVSLFKLPIMGESFSMPYSEFQTVAAKLLIAKHGGMKQTRYEPKDEAELQARIMQEHYIQTHPRKQPRN